MLICGLVCGVMAAGWVLAGRHLVTLVDRLTLAVVERRNVARVLYDAGTLELSDIRLDLSDPSFVPVVAITLSSAGRAVLESGARRFALGSGKAVPPMTDAILFEFTKDAGDDVALSLEQSRMSWPTPFEMNFMTGYSPSWKRNAYVRLRWTKRSGARLDMLWKTGQGYYRQDGWLPFEIKAVTSGLIHVDIRE